MPCHAMPYSPMSCHAKPSNTIPCCMTPCCNLSDRFVTRPDPYSEGVTKATNIYEQSGNKEATWAVLWADTGNVWQRVKRLDAESKATHTDEPNGSAEPEVPEGPILTHPILTPSHTYPPLTTHHSPPPPTTHHRAMPHQPALHRCEHACSCLLMRQQRRRSHQSQC